MLRGDPFFVVMDVRGERPGPWPPGAAGLRLCRFAVAKIVRGCQGIRVEVRIRHETIEGWMSGERAPFPQFSSMIRRETVR